PSIISSFSPSGGSYALQLSRSASVANYEIRASPYSAYLQESCDDGQTWNDILKMAGFNSTVYVPLSAITKPDLYLGFNSLVPITDGNFTEGTSFQGPIGNLFRVRYDSRVTKNGFSFQAYLHAN